MSRFQYESIKLVHLFPGLQKARLLRCHIVVMFMTLWKISLVECVQHVHMLELRNWRSFQEELPSFVLLCSSTMSFHRMFTLFGAVLNCVLLTITITMIYSFWYPANSGFFQAGRYTNTTEGEKLLQVTVCFSIEHVYPRDACVKNIKWHHLICRKN